MDLDEPRKLSAPRDGVPRVVEDADSLREVASRFAAGSGPVAVDAERASGYRYGQRAFLVQLRREGAGTALIDPVPLPDLSGLCDALADAEWIVHAASQDLPCLAEVGMRPRTLFDTELAARLAGYPRVGLAAIVEELLGWQLAKEHSAVDWSTRPLPESWLRYAALDVEVLIDLRNALAQMLASQGKQEWARQEFAAVAAAPPPSPRVDPWRRTSGLHRVRTRRQLAVVRELWNAREQTARARDVAPGRILSDGPMVDAALALPVSVEQLVTLPVFGGRANRRLAERWFAAIERARRLSDNELPPQTLPTDGPPPPRLWAERDPLAARRLTAARDAVRALAQEHNLPVENLLTPDLLRRLAWSPPADPTCADAVARALRDASARAWQVDVVSEPIAAAFAAAAEPQPPAEPEAGPATDHPRANADAS